MSTPSDIVGQFVMQNLRDVTVELCEGLCEERFSSPGHKELQIELRQFSHAQKELLKKCVAYCVDGGINDFIYRLEDKKSKSPVALIAISPNQVSADSLHEQLYGESGWKNRYSKFDREGQRRPNQAPEPTAPSGRGSSLTLA